MSLFPIIPPTLAPVTVTKTANAVNASNLTVYTFSSQSLGTAAPDRKIAAGISATAGSVGAISSVTIGGISATLVVAAYGGTDRYAEIWQADVPTGATGDVVVTWASAKADCGIGVWAVYGAAAAANDTGSSIASPMTDTLNVPDNGIAIGYAAANDTSTYTWTNLDEDFDEVVDAAQTHSGASKAFEAEQTGLTITATESGSPTETAMSLASWGPV